MHWTITVSRDDEHVFTTSDGSITDKQKVKEMMALFEIKFPASAGYKLQCLRWEYLGYDEIL